MYLCTLLSFFSLSFLFFNMCVLYIILCKHILDEKAKYYSFEKMEYGKAPF